MPSRERPQNVERLGKAARETVGAAGELLFIFDDDDPCIDENLDRADAFGWQSEIQPHMITVPKVNAAAARHLDDVPVIMFLGDDHVPRTPYWDNAIADAFHGLHGTGIVYPWGLGRTDTPEVWAVSTNIVKSLGWFGYPGVQHFYVDNVWADLGNGAECMVFLQDVILEHMHWTFGKGPRDHINELAIGCTAADERAYNEWRNTQMAADIAIIRNLRKSVITA